MDWSLRACARKGHITYAPDETALRDRLHATTPVGEVWRCLRCGSFVPGPPVGTGPAVHAPIVLRGRALRDAFIIRLFACEKLVRGLFLALLASAIWVYRNQQASLKQLFEDHLPSLRDAASRLNVDLDRSSVVHFIRHLLNINSSTLEWVAIGVTGYALLELVEGVGLWMLKRWAEYLTVVATAAFLPLEIVELAKRVSYFKISILVLNLAAVAYLILAKHLFGVRGGHAALEAVRHEESLLEVEEAARTLQPEEARP